MRDQTIRQTNIELTEIQESVYDRRAFIPRYRYLGGFYIDSTSSNDNSFPRLREF